MTSSCWAAPLGCTILFKAKLSRDQLWVLLGSLHEESSSGCKDPGHGLSLLPLMSSPEAEERTCLPPGCCAAWLAHKGEWSRLRRAARVSVSTDPPPFMFPVFAKKDSTKQQHHKSHILTVFLAPRMWNMHMPWLQSWKTPFNSADIFEDFLGVAGGTLPYRGI